MDKLACEQESDMDWARDLQRFFPTQIVVLLRIFLTLFIHRRNLVESVTKQYLKKCTYHKGTDSLCPVFELGYIVKESGQNFTFLAVKVLQFQMLFLGVDGRGTLAVQLSPAVEMIFCFLKNA